MEALNIIIGLTIFLGGIAGIYWLWKWKTNDRDNTTTRGGGSTEDITDTNIKTNGN